jgi:hypothetical protein
MKAVKKARKTFNLSYNPNGHRQDCYVCLDSLRAFPGGVYALTRKGGHND